MAEPVKVKVGGIEIEVTPDDIDIRQSRILSLIKHSCDQLGGKIRVTQETIAGALTRDGLKTNRRQVKSVMDDLVDNGQVNRRRRGNRWVYWLGGNSEEQLLGTTLPLFGANRGGLAVVAAVSAPPKPTGPAPRTIGEAVPDAPERTPGRTSGRTPTANPASDRPDRAPPAESQPDTPPAAGPAGWRCPVHPDRTPVFSKYNRGELRCTQHTEGVGWCNHSSRKPSGVAPTNPPGEDTASRGGYVDQAMVHDMGPSFFN